MSKIRLQFQDWTWQDWTIVLLVVLAGMEMAWLSVRRAMGLNALWLDLGTMTQSISSVWRGQPLMYTNISRLQNVSRLAGHVEVIYFLFAPLLKLYPSPFILLLAQAGLYASGGIAFYRLGRRMSGKSWGLLGSVVYLWYPVAQTAVLFDFHGDTLAMPLLAWALDALYEQRWRWYYAFIGLALLCKMYVAAPVFLMGIVLWQFGAKRHGLYTGLLAATWGSVAFFLLRSWFASDWTQFSRDYVSLYYGNAVSSFSGLERLLVAVVVLAPLAFGVTSRGRWWLLPALSIFLPALLSAHGYRFIHHHYAVSVPFFVASIMEMPPETIIHKGTHNGKILLKGAFAAFVVVTLNIFFVLLFPLKYVWSHPLKSPATERYHELFPWIQTHVPPLAPLAATPSWSPFLAFRPVVYQTFNTQTMLNEPLDLSVIQSQVDFFVVDAFFENDNGANLEIERDVLETLSAPESKFKIIAARDGIFIFQKCLPTCRGDVNTARPIPGSRFPKSGERRSLENGIMLKNWFLEPYFDGDEWQLSFSYTWARETNDTLPSLYAVTRLEGYPNSRALHAKTWAVLPTSAWRTQQRIEEKVLLTIPHREGCYPIRVAWYTPSAAGMADDTRRLQSRPLVLGGWQMEAAVGKGRLVTACP